MYSFEGPVSRFFRLEAFAFEVFIFSTILRMRPLRLLFLNDKALLMSSITPANRTYAYRCAMSDTELHILLARCAKK